MENFFNYITSPLGNDEIDVWFKSNNICFEKLELDHQGTIAYDIVGIKGHGVVAIDTSPWRAYEHIERLEHIARIVLASGKY